MPVTGWPNHFIAAGCTASVIQRSSADTIGQASVAGGDTDSVGATAAMPGGALGPTSPLPPGRGENGPVRSMVCGGYGGSSALAGDGYARGAVRAGAVRGGAP